MRKHYVSAAAVVIALFLSVVVAASQSGGAAAIGGAVADFTLPDTNGKEHSLANLKGAKGTALIFISVQCPVSNGYNERMAKLAADYKARGVNVIGINANATESVDVVKRHAAEKNLGFVVLKDTGNKVADRLGATVTPEVFLLDASNKLVYRGRIDNSQKVEGVNSNDLRDAMDATIAGKPVTKTEARAFGCSIKRA